MLITCSSILLMLPACWSSGKQETKKEQSLYVLNVLDKDAYDDCRIAGSTNVPFQEVETFAKGLDRNAEIVVYCANYTCSASGAAAQKLKAMGFQKVWAYEGGTAEWYQAGLKEANQYPVEGSCKATYLAAANEKPVAMEEELVPVISLAQLREKMQQHGLLAPQGAAGQEEVPQAAA